MRKQNKKIITVVLLMCFSLLSLVGCGKSKEKEPSLSNIKQEVSKVTDFSKMREGNVERLKKLYNITSNDVEEFILYTPNSNIKADEIFIAKVKEDKDIEKVKEKVTKRVDKQAKNFKDYLPKEYDLIENHQIKVNGKYIIMCISKDAEKIVNSYEKAFK